MGCHFKANQKGREVAVGSGIQVESCINKLANQNAVEVDWEGLLIMV